MTTIRKRYWTIRPTTSISNYSLRLTELSLTRFAFYLLALLGIATKFETPLFKRASSNGGTATKEERSALRRLHPLCLLFLDVLSLLPLYRNRRFTATLWFVIRFKNDKTDFTIRCGINLSFYPHIRHSRLESGMRFHSGQHIRKCYCFIAILR